MRRLGDRGERGDGDRRSRQMVLDEEQQQVPGRVFFGDRNQFLERLSDPFEKRNDPQEFVFGHPIAGGPGFRGSSRSSRPSPPVRRRDQLRVVQRERSYRLHPSRCLESLGNNLFGAQGREQIVESIFRILIDREAELAA